MAKPTYRPLKLRHGDLLYDCEVFISREKACLIYGCSLSTVHTYACKLGWRSISPRPKHERLTAFYAFPDVLAAKRSRQLPGRKAGTKNKSETPPVPVVVLAPRVSELKGQPLVDFSKH